MADAEAAVAVVEEVVAVEAAEGEERAPAAEAGADGEEQAAAAGEGREPTPLTPEQEALLVFGPKGGKAKRPERPDNTERDLQVQKLQEEIDKVKARVSEISAILDSKSGGNKGGSPEQQAARAKVQQLRNDFGAVLLQKKQLQAARGDVMTEREKLRAEQRALKEASRGPLNVEAIDERLREMEFKLTHESMSAAEEKKLREAKERLARSERPAAARHAELGTKINEVHEKLDGFKAQLAELDGQLNAIKAQQEAATAELDALRGREAEARADIPGLIAEKKEMRIVIDALIKKQREIREAHNAKWDAFKAADRAWRAWAAIDRNKRNAERKKEWEQRQAARKERELASRPAKWDTEVLLCEQALSYLAKYVEGSDKKADAGSAAAKTEAADAPAPGMKLLKKKDDEDLGWLAGSGKKGKGAKREAARAAASVPKGPVKLPTMDFETLKTFLRLGVAAPATTAEVPRAIEELTTKKAEYEAKREAAKNAPEEEAQEEATAEEGAKAEEGSSSSSNGKGGEEAAGSSGEPGTKEAEEAAVAAASANGGVPKAVDAPAVPAWGPGKGSRAAAAAPAAAAAASANGDSAAQADSDVGVKLRVSDCGKEVKLQLSV